MDKKYLKDIKSNIWKYYLFEALWSLMFFFPIFQLFYLARGLTITQIAFLGVAFSIARVIAEMPSGILADRWGRKKTLFLSQSFFLIDVIILIFFQSFWMFMIAAVFSGLWIAFYSGTANAFLYDTLKELKREKEFEKISGKLYFFTGGIISFVAAFFAGFLFNISITLPYILTAISIFLSLMVITSFTEPRVHKQGRESLFIHFKESLMKIVKNEYLGFIVIFGTVLLFGLEYLFHYGQIYLKSLSVPVVLFGVIFGLKGLMEGGGGFFADKIKNRFSYRGIFTFVLLFSLIIIFGLSYLNNYIGVFVFLLSFFIMGLFRIIQLGYIHKRIESHNRATVNSMISFLIAFIMIIFEPIAGKIADLYSIRLSFFILGCILLLYSVYFFIVKFPKKKLFFD